jgi:hypothetical protein
MNFLFDCAAQRQVARHARGKAAQFGAEYAADRVDSGVVSSIATSWPRRSAVRISISRARASPMAAKSLCPMIINQRS